MNGKVSVLQVLGSLGVGGVETWLTQVAGIVDRSRVSMDFLVHTRTDQGYEGLISRTSSRVLYCPMDKGIVRYVRHFQKIVEEAGPYHVVHSHVHHFSGLVLGAAYRCGIPGRIAHSHSDTRTIDRSADVMRRVYLLAMKAAVGRYATEGFAASTSAASALFGEKWSLDSRFRVFHCGIDVPAYAKVTPREAVLERLGIDPSLSIIGHVGRLSEPKNHAFLVKVAKGVLELRRDVRFLWVGDGPLRGEIERAVEKAGLSRMVYMTGLQRDVPALLAAMDIFVFPSLWEGMPLSLVEAQAAGLPCIVSDAVTEEATVVHGLVTRMPLGIGHRAWAQKIIDVLATPPEVERRQAIDAVGRSTFSLERGVRALEKSYSEYR